LEAYEDIIDSQVGDTHMVRARNLEREIGLRQIFLKFEGGNPSGTQKDRIAFAQAMDAMRRGFDALTVATCGNYGVAVAMACSLSGLQGIIFIPETYHTRRINEMVALGAEIRKVPGDYEAAVDAARRMSVMTPTPAVTTPACNSRPMARSLTKSTTSCATRRPPLPYRFQTGRRWPGFTGVFSAFTAEERRRTCRASSPDPPSARTPSSNPI
jgi:cysteine synthase